MRLDKFLAHAGLGTRRDVQALLRKGLVRVNGEIAREGARRLDAADRVVFEGSELRIPGPVVVAFHKPAGLVTSTRDRQETIYSVLPFDPEKVRPVGRLDKETEGLLLLTDDGGLNHHLASPRRRVEKEYLADLDREIGEEALRKLLLPMVLENGEKVRAAIAAERVDPRRLRLVIDQGKYHQVRRMCAAIGLVVQKLVRTRVGPIQLGNLPLGAHKILGQDEIAILRADSGT